MPVITYLAQRELEAGHTVPTEYKIETIFKSRVRGTKKVGEESRSLDQTTESYLHAIIFTYAITSDLISTGAVQNSWREFLASVINQEQFQIDFTGTIAAPGTDVNVRMVSSNWAESELGPGYIQVQFTVREG